MKGDFHRGLTVRCQATGVPTPKIEWLRHGVHVINNTYRTVSQTKSSHILSIFCSLHKFNKITHKKMYLIPQLVECGHVTPEVVGSNPTLVNFLFNPDILIKKKIQKSWGECQTEEENVNFPLTFQFTFCRKKIVFIYGFAGGFAIIEGQLWRISI